MKQLLNKISTISRFIEDAIGDLNPEVVLILGSGLGNLADEIHSPVVLKYEKIPGFPVTTIQGHTGQLVIGNLEDKCVLVMQGRFHYYEGYSMQDITLPIRVFKSIGIEKMIITNAAGGVNKDLSPGDLMIIKDHINFSYNNPLTGKNLDEFGGRFPDMSNPYDYELIKKVKDISSKLNIQLKEGVYLYNSGPSYETPAEVKMARTLGADVVGMSTVPEVITAVHASMKVIGISCISNMAAGILNQPLHHDEVIETTEKVKDKFVGLLKEIVRQV